MADSIFEDIPHRSRGPFFVPLLFLLLILLLVAAYAVFRGATLPAREGEREGALYALGTRFQIINVDEKTKEEVYAKIRELEKLIDPRKSTSEIAQVNRLAGVSGMAVSPLTAEMVYKALRFSDLLAGYYDLTLGTLYDLWNFGENPYLPTTAEVTAAQKSRGMDVIAFDRERGTLRLSRRGVELNLKPYAVGFAVSHARQALLKKGIANALVTARKSAAAIGRKGNGNFWEAAIPNPRDTDHPLGKVELAPGEALFTLSDDEVYFTREGKRYHPVLDPESGWPAEGCQSVSIISDDAYTANIVAYAVFVMGPAKGLPFIEGMKGINAVIVDRDGKLRTSSGVNLKPL